MSGSMMQPGQAPQQPQMSPQMLQMLMAQQQQKGVPQLPMGGPPGPPQMAPRPGMPPQGGPPMVPPSPQQAGPVPPGPMSSVPPMPIPPPQGAPNGNLAAFGRMAQGQPGGQQPRLTAQEMAHLGRFGDQVIAHLTPGEVAVPPEVQTPKVMHDISQAFQKFGVSPAQFTAGSPASSTNPNTGAPEYSLWSAILPVLGAVGGAVAAPYTGGLSVPAGMAIGGALGGAAGGAMDHGTAMQIALQAAGGGAGGALGGVMGGAGAGAAGAAGAAGTSGASMMADPFAGSALSNGAGAAGSAGAGAGGVAADPFGGMTAVPANAPSSAAGNLGTFGSMVRNLPLKGGMLAGTGAALGGALAPQPTQAPYSPPGFNTPMAPLVRNPNALLGRPGQSPTPQFAGYDPYASVTTGQPYNFFPGG